MTTETRLDRGRRMLDRIDGHAGQRVIDALQDIAPDCFRGLRPALSAHSAHCP